MLDLNTVVIVDRYRISRHDIVTQSLLELGGHEVVARSGLAQDCKMDLEPEKVEEEWNDDETHSAGSKVFTELGQAQCALAPIDV